MKSPIALMLAVVAFTGAGASAPSATVPGADVVAALDRLDQPSHALPLAGDREVGVERWAHAGTCADVALAYQSAGAPVPAGSVVAPGPRQSVVVDAPYGRTGILLEDQAAIGQCVYAIATTPTVSITGAGLAVERHFVGVLCTSVLGLNLIFGEFDNAGVVTTVAAVPGDDLPWRVLIAPGTIDENLALSDAAPGTIEVDGDGTFDGAGLVFDGMGVAGPMSVRLTCTPFTPLPG